MASSDNASLALSSRSEFRSRAVRRLRREGKVPGIIYGGEAEPVSFEVDALILRNTLAKAGAVLEVTIDEGGETQPVVVKDLQRHPVRGDIMHADLLRIDMNVAIQTAVLVELTGVDEAPGVVEGGVLSQEGREVNVEALPADIPDVIQHDVSSMQINDTLLLSALTAPQGVTFVDDPEETVIATITPPTLEPVEDDIEAETELVGEDGEPVEAAEGDEGGDEPASESESSDDSE